MRNPLDDTIKKKITSLYGEKDSKEVTEKIHKLIDKYHDQNKGEHWVSQEDVMLITYGDSIVSSEEPPLVSLQNFLDKFVKDDISSVHILPFYPYTSDDGFSVVDYREINPEIGNWEDVKQLSQEYKLMFDAVINHISKSSDWFQGYLKGEKEYEEYFVEADPNEDYSKVVRPRALPLLVPFETSNGTKHIWTTFSEDQIDINYKNPKVLLEILDILLMYAANGAKYIRLDAIGFMWKEPGTTCIHLDEAHLIVKLIRDVFEATETGTIIITETNVPHLENISYFGNGSDEAHMVYQFPLPPLTLFSFHKQNTRKLMDWLASIEQPPGKTTFFNFLASHDGIGMRPTEGILTEDEREIMLEKTVEHGGFVSYKDNGDGTKSPYELNINYFDALTSPLEPKELGPKKTLAAHTILLSLAGVPGIYIHSLLGSRNYIEGVKASGINRRINREKLNKNELFGELDNPATVRHEVFNQLLKTIKVRKKEKAFDPLALQEVIYLDDRVFSIRRSSQDGDTILVVVNVSKEAVELNIETVKGIDLLSNEKVESEIILEPYQIMWIKEEQRGY